MCCVLTYSIFRLLSSHVAHHITHYVMTHQVQVINEPVISTPLLTLPSAPRLRFQLWPVSIHMSCAHLINFSSPRLCSPLLHRGWYGKRSYHHTGPVSTFYASEFLKLSCSDTVPRTSDEIFICEFRIRIVHSHAVLQYWAATIVYSLITFERADAIKQKLCGKV